MHWWQWVLLLIVLLGLALVGYGGTVARGGGLPLRAERVEKEDFSAGISPPPCITELDIRAVGNIQQLRLPGTPTLWTTKATNF